jgi:predicted TIM-barrel fold metal-dependent hydrolase
MRMETTTRMKPGKVSKEKMQESPEPGMLERPLPALDDPEGERVPAALPFIVDAHVHVFPDSLFGSIWKWFEKHGWPIRYQLKAPEALNFLLGRGIGHVIALQYAHKPGVARELNRYMANLCMNYTHVTGFASVFPGEEKASNIIEEAFKLGLQGVKLHSHVQCFDLEGEGMSEVCAVCEANGKPLVVHAGREPKSPAYQCDPYLLCNASKMENILRTHPNLRICVPHLGADEFIAYHNMLERYDNLWLDTTMTLADYLPNTNPVPLTAMREDRIMYGTDFPNIPYAWDRELKRLSALGLPEEKLKGILGGNARQFFSI